MSPPIQVIRLDNPTDEQLDAAVKLCVDAYDQDIAAKVFTGNDMSLQDPLWRSMVRAGIHSGEFYVATDGTEEVMSVGVWFGPGQVLWSSEEQRELGFNDFFRRTTEEFQKWFLNDFAPKVREAKIRYLGKDTERNSYYANLIATNPRYQHRGLASAIIKTVIDKAAESKTVVALGTQTEENAAFYRHLGFHEEGRMDEKTPWGVFTGNLFTLKPSA